MFDRKAYNDAYRASHLEKIRSQDRARGPARRSAPGYKEYQANKVLKCRYGISLEQKKQMYEDQKGLCKLCGEPLLMDYRKAHIDHDHETDEIRGLLHSTCNWLIGFVENNNDLIGTIQGYLERVKVKTNVLR